MMQITINGQTKDLSEGLNLEGIIEQLCKNPSHVIAEVNGNIIKSAQWMQTGVQEGDKIELVTFVGGG